MTPAEQTHADYLEALNRNHTLYSATDHHNSAGEALKAATELVCEYISPEGATDMEIDRVVIEMLPGGIWRTVVYMRAYRRVE